MRWTLSDAKNKFSQVFEMALKNGPQYISRHGKENLVLVNTKDFDIIPHSSVQQSDLVTLLLNAPKCQELADLLDNRDRTPYDRHVEF